LGQSENKLIWCKILLAVTESGTFRAEYYHPFTMLKQNLDCDEFQDT